MIPITYKLLPLFSGVKRVAVLLEGAKYTGTGNVQLIDVNGGKILVWHEYVVPRADTDVITLYFRDAKNSNKSPSVKSMRDSLLAPLKIVYKAPADGETDVETTVFDRTQSSTILCTTPPYEDSPIASPVTPTDEIIDRLLNQRDQIDRRLRSLLPSPQQM